MNIDTQETQTPITTDELAGMIARGFKGVDEQFKETNSNIKTLQDDVSCLKQDVSILKQDVAELKETTKRIDKRLITVEDIVLKDHN